MTPKSYRNRQLADRLMARLERRHFKAYYCENSAEVRQLITRLIPERATLSWGGSDTLRVTGVTDMLKGGPYEIYDRADAKNDVEKRAVYLKALDTDFYLTSANAISEDGVIVNIDGNGNRVAAITWGPHHVIFVIGMNKVCSNPSTAYERARSTAAPINAARFDIHTPCREDGTCHQCHSPQSICNHIHFLRHSYPEHRHIVILVNEDLGY